LPRQSELAVVRHTYAKQMLGVYEIADASVEAAFAAVHREDFLGPSPWSIFHEDSREPTPSDDPVDLYSDCVVAIDPAQKINNGQPSLHTYLLSRAAPKENEHVVHIGTGLGYYTAIMAEMVGPRGRVTGIEFDPKLASRARTNLARYSNVEVLVGDGAVVPFDKANVIYVNAGATAPAAAWLDGLADDGRLILPLTTNRGFGEVQVDGKAGAVFCIQRKGDEYHVCWLTPVAIFPCAGNREPASEEALAIALGNGESQNVRRLYRHTEVPKQQCWLRGKDWCLAFD
jgi:protein-L-isoaspartate(D-aspartate) O-methyltransferase